MPSPRCGVVRSLRNSLAQAKVAKYGDQIVDIVRSVLGPSRRSRADVVMDNENDTFSDTIISTFDGHVDEPNAKRRRTP